MIAPSPQPRFGIYPLALALALTAGCSALRPSATPPASFHSLDRAQVATHTVSPAPVVWSNATPTLLVSPPHAAAGYDSQRIIYVREPHKLEYYAHNEWIDTPARMLAPLIVAVVERSGAFRAVVSTPGAAAGDLRVDTEIVRLQQDFRSRPSGVRFTLRAYIVDNTTRQVLAWREFDETVPAASEDPVGGVVAANRAVHRVLDQLAAFSAEAARQWSASAQESPQDDQ